jgi:hypothetical protein
VDLGELLECLAEAETGSAGPEYVGRRYVLVGYGSDDGQQGVDDPDEGLPRLVVLGEARSVHDALDLLAAHLVGLYDEEPDPDRSTADHRLVGVAEDDYERWLNDEDRRFAGLLRTIRTPRRRVLAYYLMGYLAGPMDIVTGWCWHAPDLDAVPLLVPGARSVFLVRSASPGNEEEAFGVLEHQPVGVPTPVDRTLAQACRSGDAEAVAVAIAAVDRLDTLDERGMSALHVAVAHRRFAAVRVLLAAGADPNVQAAYCNAPCFAGLGPDGLVGPVADRIESPEHWRILQALVEAGARLDLDFGNPSGATLLDLAIATRPYPQEWINFLVGRGARGALTSGLCLGDVLGELWFEEGRSVEIRANQVRFLLACGADPNEVSGPSYTRDRPIHILVGYPYQDHNMPAEILDELVELLLRHEARDLPSDNGRRALDSVEFWVSHGQDHFRPARDRLRAAGWSTS